MFSIKAKIIFSYTIVFGVLLIIFSYVIYIEIERTSIEKLDFDIKKYSLAVRDEISEVAGEQKGEHIRDFSSIWNNLKSFDFKNISADGLHDVRLQLFTIKGKKIITDSLLKLNNNAGIPKDASLFSKFQTIHISDKSYRIYWSFVDVEDNTPYVLETSASLDFIYSDLHDLQILFLIIIPFVLIITGFTAYVISKAAFKPVIQMAETAKLISAISLDKRLELPKANDEVRLLGETLNEMINRIDNAFKNQKQFIANASHEIKTPLTIIQSELELAERKSKVDEMRDSINIALSEVGGLTKLTNSLLTLARLDSSRVNWELSNIRLDELLTDCVQSINQTALMKNIRINLSINDAIEIKADKEKLKSVFFNLIDNAMKYSNTGAEVSVTLNKIENEKAVVTVEDKGEGISPEELPHIFKRFYRSNEIRAEINGSGLGLTIAKEIIEMHHGTITVESMLGKGTIFKVIFPA